MSIEELNDLRDRFSLVYNAIKSGLVTIESKELNQIVKDVQKIKRAKQRSQQKEDGKKQ